MHVNQNIADTDMWIKNVQYPINQNFGIRCDTPNDNQQFIASVQLDGNLHSRPLFNLGRQWSVTYQ